MIKDVEGFLADLQLSRRSPYTVRGYTYTLGRFFRSCKKECAADVTVDDMRKFLLENQKLKTNTYRLYVSSLKKFFERSNPTLFEWLRRNINIKPAYVETTPFTEKEMYALAEDLKSHSRPVWLGEMWETLHWFLLAQGSRIGETISLDMGDVVLEDGLYKNNYRAETTKTGKKRQTFIAQSSYPGALLHNYIHKYRANAKFDEPLFIGRDGNRLNKNRFEIKYIEAKKRLGIRGRCSPHVCRHTYDTFLMHKNVPLAVISSITGQSVQTLGSVYLHTTIKVKQDVARKHQIV